jgi:hypothetical protein
MMTTVLAGLLVALALVLPNQSSQVTPGAFLRFPAEALLGVALVLVLPGRGRRAVVVLGGVALGLLTIVKVFDLGFYAVLDRPFDLVVDWPLLRPAVEVVFSSFGRAGAIGAVIGAIVLAVGLLVLMPLSALRLTRLVVRHDARATRAVAALAVVCLACAAFGVRLGPTVPVAALAVDRVALLGAGLANQQSFAGEVATDAFRDTPGDQLLTGLRGKDVILTFIESYGRDAVEDPEFAPRVGAVLAEGNRRLESAGFSARSGWLTSPTVGGNSWLAHSTLLSGVWIDNQGRYRRLVKGDRFTLNQAFKRAGWRQVGVMPLIVRDWPEGEFYGFDRIYAGRDLGYTGPHFNLGTIPDQYTLSAFQRLEHGRADRPPLMVTMPLVSSHGPWAPLPDFLDWGDLDEGPAFEDMAKDGESPKEVVGDAARSRDAYRRSVEYSLKSFVTFLERYGTDRTVVVFLGDHQPAPLVTGPDASRDVPITILARDPAVLDRVSGWGWNDGLKPGPDAPVWPMQTFRDRFLTAFGPSQD